MTTQEDNGRFEDTSPLTPSASNISITTLPLLGTMDNRKKSRKTHSISLWQPHGKISMYVDLHLKPLTSKIGSYIKDTTDFLQKLNTLDKLQVDSFLVTVDVISLYTNIPHKDGIRATKYALETRTTKEPQTSVLLRPLHFILTRTAFKFNNRFYEQISGTTMGTKCAPSYESSSWAN